MQKLVLALVALTSMIVTSAGRVNAQGDLHAVDPSKGSQPINEPVDGSHPGITPTAPSEDVEPGEIVIPSAKTVDSVNVHARKLVIAGHVRHDVNATESTVVIEKGATVGGKIVVDDLSHVENLSGLSVTIKKHLSETHSGNHSSETVVQIHGGTRNSDDINRSTHRSEPDWFQAQLALTIFGFMAAGLCTIIAPSASKRVADHVSAQPKRDLKIGALVGAALLVVLVADALLLKMPLIRFLWAPFGIMIAMAPLLLLGFGWLTGMRYAGDYVAARFKRNTESSLFKRMALGLSACFVVNVILGTISPTLGVLGLFFEFGIALMGVGAAVVLAAGRGSHSRA